MKKIYLFINIIVFQLPAIAVNYNSSACLNSNVSAVFRGDDKQEILQITVSATGGGTGFDVTSFTFSTVPSTDAAGDIENTRLYGTGTSSTFSTTSQLGGTYTSPNGPFPIGGFTYNIPASGTYYFWLTYKIKSTATIGYKVDAQCTSLFADGTTRTPSVTSPAGEREIHDSYANQLAIGGTGEDYCYGAQQTSDGGYIMAGYTNSGGAGGYDVLLVKLNSNRIMQWAKTYGRAGNDYGRGIKQTTDGGYIIVGYTASDPGNFTAGNSDFYLVKTNSEGALEWSKCYGSAAAEEAYSIQQTTDGGYIFAGLSRSGWADAVMVKTDNAGSMQWGQMLSGPAGPGCGSCGNYDEIPWSVKQISDGGFLLSGHSGSFGSQGHIFILKTQPNSSVMQYQKAYNTNGSWAKDAIQTSDGGYLIVTPYNYGTFYKLNSDLSFAWGKSFPYITSYFSAQDIGGSYILGGVSQSGSSRWFHQTHISSNGSLLWNKNYHYISEPDGGQYVQNTSDGGFILAGFTGTYGAGLHDFFLIKTRSDGTVSDIPCNEADNANTPSSAVPTVSPYNLSCFATGLIKTDHAGSFITIENAPVMIQTNFCEEDAGGSLASEFINLSGKTTDTFTKLTWVYSGESTNGMAFIIQRSEIGRLFEDIGTVAFSGPVANEYSDLTTGGNTWFYRIKKIGNVGQELYSNIIEISVPLTFSDLHIENLYPNPSAGNFSLDFITPAENKEEVLIKIFDFMGQIAQEIRLGKFKEGKYKRGVETGSLAAGTYVVQLISGTQRNMETLIILNNPKNIY